MRTSPRAISLAALLLTAVGAVPHPHASVAVVDADARAKGNRPAQARAIGDAIFTQIWPAQVLDVYADGTGSLLDGGLRISGEKFHGVLTQRVFDQEIAALADRAFASAPIGELDVWVTVPVAVPKGEDVSGDLALPAWRDVFTVAIRRGEPRGTLLRRLAEGRGIFCDQDWARTAFK